MKATFGVLAVIMMAAVCLVPMVDASGDAFTPIEGEKVIVVDGSGEYTIMYSNPKLADMTESDISISYTAKLVNSNGETQSNAVSSSTGDLENEVPSDLKVTAPKTAGTYTLEVEYKCKVTGADDEVTYEDTTTETMVIKVVNPITLTVSLKGDAGSTLDPSGVGVFFYVDGEKVDDSYTTFTLNTDGTATVSYKLIDDLSDGKHTFKVVAAEGEQSMIDGLGEEHTFYVGDKSYTALTALVIVIVVLLIVVMIWVYRKPVKNFGKPKSRR